MAEEIYLTPSEDLFLEALIARYRLGESIWTFESRHKKTAESLAQKGFVGWKGGIIEKTIRVWFTAEGAAEYLSYPYEPPILKGLTTKKAGW
jgi:hypothetical protein